MSPFARDLVEHYGRPEYAGGDRLTGAAQAIEQILGAAAQALDYRRMAALSALVGSATDWRTEARPMVGSLFRLAWPILVENLLQTALGVTSLVIVARLGATAVAAVGLGNQFVQLLLVTFAGLAVGNTAIVARAIGAGDRADAARATRQALILAAGLGLLVGVVAFGASGAVLRLTGAAPDVVAEGEPYLRILGTGAVLMALMLVGGGTLRGAGDTVTPMAATLVTNVVNVAAAYVLVFGYLGAPALGVAGAAWAAVLARSLGVGLILWRLVRGGKAPALGWHGWRPHRASVLRVARIGGPAAVEQLVVQLGLMAFSMVTVHIGTAAFAAQQIVFNAAQLSQLPGMAFSVAATTAVGQALGAGSPRRAAMAGWLAFGSAAVWMSALGITYVVFAERWLRLYSDDAEILALGASVMGMLALCQPIQAAAYVLSGALRGAGDTRTTMWGGLLGTCGVRVPVAWVAGVVLGLGLYGVWLGWMADWALRAAIYTLRFKSGRWQGSQV